MNQQIILEKLIKPINTWKKDYKLSEDQIALYLIGLKDMDDTLAQKTLEMLLRTYVGVRPPEIVHILEAYHKVLADGDVKPREKISCEEYIQRINQRQRRAKELAEEAFKQFRKDNHPLFEQAKDGKWIFDLDALIATQAQMQSEIIIIKKTSGLPTSYTAIGMDRWFDEEQTKQFIQSMVDEAKMFNKIKITIPGEFLDYYGYQREEVAA